MNLLWSPLHDCEENGIFSMPVSVAAVWEIRENAGGAGERPFLILIGIIFVSQNNCGNIYWTHGNAIDFPRRGVARPCPRNLCMMVKL